MATYTAPTTRTTGALISASIWNTDIVENLKYFKDAPVFDGDVSVGDDLLLPSTGAVINFASGDVTITHSTNTLTFDGASSGYAFQTGLVSSAEGIAIAATKRFYLDGVAGTGDTYIAETASNVLRIYAGGVDTIICQSDGLYLGVMPTTATAANMVYNTGTGRIERSTSSIRYKHDVATLDGSDALAAVMAMRPVTYRGKTDDDQRRYVGFIAEEMQQWAPLLCTYDDGGESGTPNYVTYDRVTAYLVAVVQQQQTEINALKARIH